MDWYLALWTGLSWMFSGGILYLVYRFGFNNAAEQGIKFQTWRSIALLLGFLVSVAMFGTDYPDEGLLVGHDEEDISRFVGIFSVLVAAYLFGYVDGRPALRKAHKAEADHAALHVAS